MVLSIPILRYLEGVHMKVKSESQMHKTESFSYRWRLRGPSGKAAMRAMGVEKLIQEVERGEMRHKKKARGEDRRED